jgi:hypothetical protein
MNLNMTFRASNLFPKSITTANTVAMQLKNKDASPDEIKGAIYESVLLSISEETVSDLFYAASKLLPTANMASLTGGENLIDSIVVSMAKIVTNDVIRFCGINTAVVKEVTKVAGFTEVRDKKKRPDATLARPDDISDELRDELSGANVKAGKPGDDDCGDACKL